MADTDGDGVFDANDAFPLDPSESVDTDSDGVGDNSDALPTDASGSVTVSWPLDVSVAGDYVIAVRWTSGTNRSTSATYRLTIDGVTTDATVDQTSAGGGWVSLGIHNLDPVAVNEVTLIDSGSGFVIADSIRLSWAGGVVPGNQTTTLYYVHNDHLGTSQMVTDENQTIGWQAVYEAFGKATVTVNTVELPVRFPGQYFDEETGLHYNYFRDYDPTLGRYVQSDPIGLSGGLNTYGYVTNNPLTSIDPLGLHESNILSPPEHSHDNDFVEYADTSSSGMVRFSKGYDLLRKQCPRCADSVDYHESLHQSDVNRSGRDVWRAEKRRLEREIEREPSESLQDFYEETKETYSYYLLRGESLCN